MPRLRASHSLALAAFVAATVAIRLAPLVGSSPDTDADGAERVAAFFDRQGFVAREVPDLNGARVVSGEKGFCRIVVGELHLLGWQNEILRHLGQEGDVQVYLLDGVPMPEAPLWAARAAFYRDRVLRVVGRGDERTRLFGILISQGCAGHQVDWSPLQD